jgi:hypothetical protein
VLAVSSRTGMVVTIRPFNLQGPTLGQIMILVLLDNRCNPKRGIGKNVFQDGTHFLGCP